MSTSYPGSVDPNTGPNLYNNRAINTGDPANDHNNLVDATIALQSKLGAGASLPTIAGQVLTANGTGSSWATPTGASTPYKVVGQSNADVIVANNGNIGAVINTLTTQMIADGKYGTIYVKRGTYTVETPIIVKTGVNIVGDGIGDNGTIFQAKNALNDDVFRADGFSDQSNHNYVGYDAKTKYIRLENFEVRGNSAGQTASTATSTTDPATMRTLIKLYGYKIYVHNLMLRDAIETAFYSEFSNSQPQAFENYETLPNIFDLIDIKGYNTYGFVYRGPHDSYLNRIFAATAGANFAGMLFDQGTNYGLANTHIFESYANGNASIANVLVKGSPSLTGRIYAEGAQNAPAFDIMGSACDMDLIAGYAPIGLVLRGNSGNSSRNHWRLQFFFDEPPTGLKLDGNVQYNNVEFIGAFPDTTLIDTSTYTGGNNTFKGRAYGAKMFSDGTKIGNTDIVQLQSDIYPDANRVSNFSWPVADTSFKLLSTGTDKYVDAGGLAIRNTAKGVNASDSASVNQLGRARNSFNVLDYGAKGDGRRAQYVGMASGSNAINCTQANFTQADVGKIVYGYQEYQNATAGTGQAFISTIATVTDSAHATIAGTAAFGLNGGASTFLILGSDDSAAIQATINAATLSKPSGQNSDTNNPFGAGYSEVYIPAASTGTNGIYLVANAVTVNTSVMLDAPGMLVNVTSSLTAPFLVFQSYSKAKKLVIEAGGNAGIASGSDNTKQAHIWMDDVTIWHIGIGTGQYGITLNGYDHHFKKIYLKAGNVGVYHNTGSDFSCELLFAIGCVTAVSFNQTSQAHYNNILCDTGNGRGIVVNGGSGNIYASIQAFEAAGTSYITSPILSIGDSSTTVNRDLVFDLQADCTGGTMVSIANVKDTRISFLASNTATAYGASQPITTGVVYGSNVDASVTIKGHMSTGITPFTGTKAGTYEYTQGAQRTFTTPLSMSSNKITDVVDPTSAQDVATKAYVDANAGSGGTGTTPDATTSAKGKIQLAGDFDPSSTAAVPKIAFANDTLHALKAGDTFTGAMNTQNLLPATTTTYTLGAAAAYYNSLFATTLNLNSTASISGVAAGQLAITGTANIAAGGQINLYNTTDQTTSYQRLRYGITSGVWQLFTENGGSASLLPIQFGSPNGYINFVPANNSGNPKFQLLQTGDTSGSIFNIATGTNAFTWGSGEQYFQNISGTVKQTGTSNYAVYKAAITETTVGSGTNYLINLAVNGAVKFSVDTAGNVVAAGVRKDRIVTSSSATSFTPNAATTDVHRATLTGNNTLNVPSGTPVDEQKLTVETIQDSTGGRSLTLASGFYIPPSLSAPTLTTTAGAVNILGFRYNGVLAKWVYYGLL